MGNFTGNHRGRFVRALLHLSSHFELIMSSCSDALGVKLGHRRVSILISIVNGYWP